MTPSSSAKRAIDVIAAAAGLVLTAPVQAIVAVAIARRLGRPVLFRQVRAGVGGRPFTLVKFRTMRPVDAARGLVDDSDRITRLGIALRSTSLDELPTLWNVLRGDMSLVGPRPLPVAYLDRYSPTQARRHEVRPGVTGLAQVSGRNSLTWDERLRLDVIYVDGQSLVGDLRIIGRTLRAVARRDGISADNHATMPEFTGPSMTEDGA